VTWPVRNVISCKKAPVRSTGQSKGAALKMETYRHQPVVV